MLIANSRHCAKCDLWMELSYIGMKDKITNSYRLKEFTCPVCSEVVMVVHPPDIFVDEEYEKFEKEMRQKIQGRNYSNNYSLIQT